MSDSSADATLVIRKHWQGFAAVRFLIIFGDSYSAVGYDSSQPHPTKEQPLGVPYPGPAVWTESDGFGEGTPNWVGWLLTEFYGSQNILVYDYAVGGDTVGSLQHSNGVVRQVQSHFLKSVGLKPEWAPWSQTDSPFVTWIGINDAAYGGEETYIRSKLDILFEQQTALYNAGARNFLFIDVPPIYMCPGATGDPTRYQLWNKTLKKYISDFASKHSEATTMVFSSYNTFSRLLQNPVTFGFEEKDVRKFAGNIWIDHIHPTSRVHWVIAKDISTFLNAQASFKEPA